MLPDDAPVFAGWECIEKLGEGGMCSVWRVRPAAGDGPERAIKVLHDTSPGSADRFAAEARLLQRIDHPNVLRIHELHDEVRPPWIVMDLLAGRDLEETREEQGAMDPERAARLFADVADGLAAVHALGVRHRDIKPANIMLGHDGVPRLIDFGIARETARAHVTQKGFVVGTASYLPPEIFVEDDARGVQDSEPADVYALGQSLCEVLTGVPIHPRTEGTGASLLVQILKDKVDRPHLDPREWRPSVPDELAEIVVAATRQEPSQRVQTAEELEERLRTWLERRQAGAAAPLTDVDPTSLPPPPTGAIATGPGTPAPAPRRPGRAAAAVGAAGIGLAALLAVGTLAGAGALVAFAPAPSPPDPALAGALAEAAAAAGPALAQCAEPDTRGALVARFVAHGGAVRDLSVSADPSAPVAEGVARCVTEQLAGLRLPDGAPAVVRLPIHFEGTP